ncbi:MAG: HIT family hydrolase [Candidatus Cloacimonadota bacterium]|nr:MAG: HIT family hydrolase [Candidatus Cloacimonadota bacterium]
MPDLLYSPWRLQYILSEKSKECIFCVKPEAEEDKKNFILKRMKHCFVILNVFPYNNGHLMVVPYKHVSSLVQLSPDEVSEIFKTVRLCEEAIRKCYKPDGLNVGLNIGKAAGAGIDEHLHVHVLPRWNGDHNFMTTIGGTRIIPEEFERTYNLLLKEFEKIEE